MANISRSDIHRYFENYFFNPLHARLSIPQKILCLISTISISVLSVGIIPLILKLKQKFTKINLNIPTSHFFRAHERIANVSQKVFVFSEDKTKLGKLKRSNFSKVIDTQVLNQFYRKPIPKKEEVLIPVIPELKLTSDQVSRVSIQGELQVIKFVDLSREQKIILNNHFGRHHNQIHKSANSITDQEIDEYFFTKHGQSTFLVNDPKGGHGCDHAIRTTLLAGIFGYLYQKYDPKVSLSEPTLLVSQIVTACHDSGRSSEGTDVYDDISAQNTIKVLNDLGVKDEKLLADAQEAIANKDSSPIDAKNPKSLIARIVQNADSADFTRIILKSPTQDLISFNSSLEFLDIYKEMKEISKGDKNFILKDGLTYGNFLDELELLMQEKNQLSFETHQKQFREQASDPAKNYFQEVLQVITFDKFPHLNYVLSMLNINSKNPNNAKLMAHADYARLYGKDLKIEELQQKMKELQSFPESALRNEILMKYEKRIKQITEPKTAVNYSFFEEELVKKLSQEEIGHVGYERLSTQEVHVLRQQMNQINSSLLSKTQLTDLANIYEKIICYYASNKMDSELQAVLHECSQKVILSQDSTVYKILKSSANLSASSPTFLHVDSSFVRRRQLRLQRKEFSDGTIHTEAAFEFRNSSRQHFNPVLERLKESPPSGFIVKESIMRFYGKDEKGFSKEKFLDTSPSIIIEKDGISLEIGTDKQIGNCWSLAIIKAPPNSTPDKIQEFLCQVGLPLTLCNSRPQDEKKEFLYKAIQFRFPDKVFSHYPKKSVEELYDTLSPTEKATIDNDLKNRSLKQVGQNYFEQVQPEYAKEVRDLGAIGFLTNINASDTATAASILKNILQSGLLSTTERYMRGILGFGTCPAYNMKHGSANQTFTRLMTNEFIQNMNLSSFSYGLSNIYILFDPQAAERMPYSYPSDLGGIRNPEFTDKEFKIHGTTTVLNNFKGNDILKYRTSLPRLINNLNDATDDDKRKFIGNEVMFENSLTPQYIKAIIVPSSIKLELIQLLKFYGIYELNGKPIEEYIIDKIPASEK